MLSRMRKKRSCTVRKLTTPFFFFKQKTAYEIPKNPAAARKRRWKSFLGRIRSISHLMSRGSSKNIKLLSTIKDTLTAYARRRGRSWRANQRNCMLGFVVKGTPGTSRPTSRQDQAVGFCPARPFHILRWSASHRAFRDDSCSDVASLPEPPEFYWR